MSVSKNPSARVKVLGQYIRHHVKEEEGELFRHAASPTWTRGEIGARLQKRKDQLTEELASRLFALRGSESSAACAGQL